GAAAPPIRAVRARAGVPAPTIPPPLGERAPPGAGGAAACFVELDRPLGARPAPADPVEALRSGFDRYIDYGLAHPTHYRLMFSRRRAHPTPAALASYDGLRRRGAAPPARRPPPGPHQEAAPALSCRRPRGPPP